MLNLCILTIISEQVVVLAFKLPRVVLVASIDIVDGGSAILDEVLAALDLGIDDIKETLGGIDITC